MSNAEGWGGDQGRTWGCKKDKRIVSKKKVKRRKKNLWVQHRGRGRQCRGRGHRRRGREHAANRRQGQEGREHLETSVSSAEGWDGDQGRMWGHRKDKQIVSEKSERRKKKTHGRNTEAEDVDAEAGNMQQAGDRARKGESTWKRV